MTSLDGTATIDSSGVVTVAGLADGQSATVTVTTTRTGYTTLAAPATGAALLTGTGPTLSTPTQTDDGFTFTITNFDPTITYTATTTGGTVVIDHHRRRHGHRARPGHRRHGHRHRQPDRPPRRG